MVSLQTSFPIPHYQTYPPLYGLPPDILPYPSLPNIPSTIRSPSRHPSLSLTTKHTLHYTVSLQTSFPIPHCQTYPPLNSLPPDILPYPSLPNIPSTIRSPSRHPSLSLTTKHTLHYTVSLQTSFPIPYCQTYPPLYGLPPDILPYPSLPNLPSTIRSPSRHPSLSLTTKHTHHYTVSLQTSFPIPHHQTYPPLYGLPPDILPYPSLPNIPSTIRSPSRHPSLSLNAKHTLHYTVSLQTSFPIPHCQTYPPLYGLPPDILPYPSLPNIPSTKQSPSRHPSLSLTAKHTLHYTVSLQTSFPIPHCQACPPLLVVNA